MRPHGVVAPPRLDQVLDLLKRAEDLSVRQLVEEPGVRALHAAVLPWAPRPDVGRPRADGGDSVPDRRRQHLGPSSDRTPPGASRSSIGSTSVAVTAAELSRRSTRIAGRSRVNPSTTHGTRNLRPSRVRSSTTSPARTRIARSGRRRAQKPSVDHRWPLLVVFPALSAPRVARCGRPACGTRAAAGRRSSGGRSAHGSSQAPRRPPSAGPRARPSSACGAARTAVARSSDALGVWTGRALSEPRRPSPGGTSGRSVSPERLAQDEPVERQVADGLA